MNKKGDGGLVAIIIVLIALIFLGWLVNIGSRECNSNKDCKEDSYCGSDFACHKYPLIQKNMVQVSYTAPIVIICVTAIMLAIIFRWDKIFSKKRIKNSTETSEAYYTPQVEQTK